MNRVILSGNLGADAEIRTAGEYEVAVFSIAVTESVKKQGQWVNESTWFKCEKWNPKGLANLLTKGQKVLISGKIQIQEHEGKFYTKIKADEVELIGEKKEKPQGGQKINGDLPF